MFKKGATAVLLFSISISQNITHTKKQPTDNARTRWHFSESTGHMTHMLDSFLSTFRVFLLIMLSADWSKSFPKFV